MQFMFVDGIVNLMSQAIISY